MQRTDQSMNIEMVQPESQQIDGNPTEAKPDAETSPPALLNLNANSHSSEE